MQSAPDHRPVCVALLRSPARLLRLLGLALLFEGLCGGLLTALASALVLGGHFGIPSSPSLDSSLIVVSPNVCGKGPHRGHRSGGGACLPALIFEQQLTRTPQARASDQARLAEP